MIGKLIKHEWKATYRVFLLLYAAVFLISILSYGGFQWGNSFIREISTLVISMSFGPVMVVYIVTIFNGYTKSVYGDEGYLTHTLPVRGREILLSKTIIASVWGILTIIVGTVCGMGILVALESPSFAQLTEAIQYISYLVGAGNIAAIIFMVFLTAVQFLIKIYFAVAVSKLPVVTRFNGFVSLLVFVVATYFQDKLYSFIGNQLGNTFNTGDLIINNAYAVSQVLGRFGIFHIVFTIVFAAIYFIGSSYILEKKLHVR